MKKRIKPHKNTGPKPLIVCVPFWSGDAWLAKKNLEWWIELDQRVPYEVVLSTDIQTDTKEVKALAAQFFTRVYECKYDRVAETKWPWPQNNAFMQTGWYFYHNFPGRSWLWIESDCTVLSAGWIQRIEACHVAGKKAFSGHWNYGTNVFNGTGVYPSDISRYAPKALTAALMEGYQVPWDVYCSQEVKPYLNVANDIFQHIWNDNGTNEPCTFPTRESVRDIVRPGVALFHRCKDFSLAQWKNEVDAIGRVPLLSPDQPKTEPTVTLLYVYPASGYDAAAVRFVESYQKHPPEFPHSTVIVVNGGNVTLQAKKLFSPLNPSYLLHDNSGWDIGAFLAAAPHLSSEAVLCLGANTHFRQSGWLKRYIEIWQKLGPGMYGTLASNEIRPHLCTTGFLTTPALLHSYPHKVLSKEERYEFEWGKGAFWRRVARAGLPVKMVTWDGVYGMDELRKPPNIFRRGDQSNCMVYFTHTDLYDAADDETKKRMGMLADTSAKQLCPLAQRVDAASPERRFI